MPVPTAAAPVVLHLSLVVGGALRDEAGARLGRVEDLIVRLGQPGYPPISGVLATVADRPDEVLLKSDVLDRQLINVDGARLVRANEIELARLGGWWRVVGVDTGARGALRRLLPRRAGDHVAAGEFLDIERRLHARLQLQGHILRHMHLHPQHIVMRNRE